MTTRERARRRSGVPRCWPGCALVAMALSSPALGQPGETPGAPPPADLLFGEEIDVRVVNIEVVVEDRKGERVRGLSRDDFRILVDGEEVDVQYFSEVADGQVVMGAGDETPPALAGGQDVVTNYVLFVDDDHTQVTLRRPVLRGFRARLDTLGALDQVAVVVMSHRRLEIVSRFTTDRDATRAALAELEVGGRYGGLMSRWAYRKRLRNLASSTSEDAVSPPEGASPAGRRIPPAASPAAGRVGGTARPAPVRGFSNTPGGFGALGPYSAGRISADLASGWDPADWAESTYRAEDLRFSIDSVISTMRALEAPRGRNVLLLLAGDWPTLYSPSGSGRLRGLLWTSPFANVSTDLEMLDELIDTANLLGYTVYPMDQQRAPQRWLWSNLRYMARDTGGRAFMAGSNVKALEKVAFDASNYYWLGFVPDYRRDDRAHDIRVEVRAPGTRARYRRGYLDLSGRVEADMEALRELLFPPEVDVAGGPLVVEVGEAAATKRRTIAVPVSVRVPVGRFPAAPHDDGFRQRLEVRFVALDRFGRRSEFPADSLSLGGGYEPVPDEAVVYSTTLTMRRRPQELVVTVHDPVSKLTARGRVAIGVER